MITRKLLLIWLATTSAAAATGTAAASAPRLTYTITLKGHVFEPSTLRVPAGQSFRIEFVNQDASADEVDSDALGWDKPIPPHGKVILTVSPLKPGSYPFSGELHPKSAHGDLIAIVEQSN